ncbi:MAG: DUF1540 domain-containing protein [Lachnospiraceae bacterium]|nr:DUF1540 domain-containing protein [Lachnospiraceae bacterium]
MTKLECSVTNCLHNCDKQCCKQAIIVDGQEAKDKDETCCGSFDENKEGFFKNVFKTPENRLEIDCEAVKCVYNENRHCAAEHIGIAGDGASKAEQTLCSSFKMR